MLPELSSQGPLPAILTTAGDLLKSVAAVLLGRWLMESMNADFAADSTANIALIGAYRPEGYEWVDELCQVLTENVDYAYNFILENFEGVTLAKPQGTYMLFLDCAQWCASHGKTIQELLDAGMEYGVIWQDGRPFHGEQCIRMNLALPKSRVCEAFDRLKKYVF